MAEKPLVTFAVAGAPGHGADRVVDALAVTQVASTRLGLARERVVEGTRATWVLADGPSSCLLGALARADAMLLVVEAARGPQERTRDAVESAAAMGVTHVIAYVVTDDATDALLLDACEVLLRELLDDAGLDANTATVVHGPADAPPDALREALDAVTPTPRDVDATLSMPVSFTFRSATYAEPVVTGLVMAGRAALNAEVRCIGTRPLWAEPDVVARISRIEAWHSEHTSVDAGAYVGLTLSNVRVASTTAPPAAGLPRDVVALPANRAHHLDRNTVLLVGAGAPLASVVELRITLASRTRGGRWNALLPGARPVYAFGGAYVDGITDAGAPIDVGTPTLARVALRKQLPLAIGARCALLENGRTIGAAVVTRILPDTSAPRARRSSLRALPHVVAPGSLVDA